MGYVIPAIEINAVTLTSTNVTEPFAPANYNAATNYGSGDFVTDTADGYAYKSKKSGNLAHTPSTSPSWWQRLGPKEVVYNGATPYAIDAFAYKDHRIYQSLQGANTGHDPISSPTWWIDVGPTNQYAMFDTAQNTITWAASPISVVITPGERFTKVGLSGLNGDTVRCRIEIGGIDVYDETKSILEHSSVETFMEYVTATFRNKEVAVFSDLPPNVGAIVKIDISSVSGPVGCGGVTVGKAVELGAFQYNGTLDGLNFSTIERNTYGEATLIPRRTVPVLKGQLWFDLARIRDLIYIKNELNAVPALWVLVGDEDSPYFETNVIMGIYKQFLINDSYTDKGVLDLEVEEI